MRIDLPELSVVMIIGTSGSGKSTFCRKHFLPTETLSSDFFRGLVSDDENRLDISTQAFDSLHYVLSKRLELAKLTVIDATNVQKEARAPILKLAEKYHALKIAIVLDVPEQVCIERNKLRADRQFGANVIYTQHRDLKAFFRHRKSERFHKVYVLKPEDIDSVEITRSPLFSKRHDEHGPFDIIGDVHGCMSELSELVTKLGWQLEPELSHHDRRKLVFVGDLVDRGPDPVGVLRFVMSAVKSGNALVVPGNHDVKLAKALNGSDVSQGHGHAETMKALQKEAPDFQEEVRVFLHDLTSHLMLDDGKLCVAHAGMPAEMQGRGSGAVRNFALYGETTGEVDEFGLPVRYPWAEDYRGCVAVVYGHTPVPEIEWINNTVDIDTGCCFGGALTALQWPERNFVQVTAKETYCEPVRPLQVQMPVFSAQHELDTMLDLNDVMQQRVVETSLSGRVLVRDENRSAALEVMSRFATDPKWIAYLPPTMSPCATSQESGFLEYPTEAFSYYRENGQSQVICEEKHMGSRSVVVLARNADAARQRFGVETGESGVILTRTGRRFFEDACIEAELVGRWNQAFEPLMNELESDWLILDAELMPWSAKAIGLLKSQYAPVGSAATAHSAFLDEVITRTEARSIDVTQLSSLGKRKVDSASKFVDAYRRYCWTVNSVDDYVLAPFHILASEGRLHTDQPHIWHMETLAKACENETTLRKTPTMTVRLDDETSVAEACEWWRNLVQNGGEGMVVKPWDFIARKGSHPIQPAIKCRGPEYLRIIYGPEYLAPENLSRLRNRGLSRKRGLAMKEFALGIEALNRFVRREPLRRVHECVFALLALESEPVDPRL